MKSNENNKLHGTSIEKLIAAPLIALAKASSNLADKQVEFILNSTFTKDLKNESYTPIMIKMELSRSVIVPNEDPKKNPTIEPSKTMFELPILTLIPINSLSIQGAKLKYSIDIVSQNKRVKNLTLINYDGEEIEFFGKIKSKSDRNNSDSTSMDHSQSLSIEIDINESDNTKGINTIIEALNKAIEPIEIKRE